MNGILCLEVSKVFYTEKRFAGSALKGFRYIVALSKVFYMENLFTHFSKAYFIVKAFKYRRAFKSIP